MSRGDLAPAPFDFELGGVGLMAARGPQPPETDDTAPPAEGILEQSETFGPWYGGMGLRADDGSPEAKHTFYCPDYEPASSAEAIGGGMDTSWGGAVPGPQMNLVTVDVGKGVRSFKEYDPGSGTTTFYAAIGKKVYASADPTFAAASVLTTLESTVTRLETFKGTNGGNLLVICQQFGAVYYYDGTTVLKDASAVGRPGSPGVRAWLTTVDGGVNYVDDTAVVSDGNLATGSNLNGLPALGGGGHVLLAYEHLPSFVDLKIGSPNGSPNVLSAHYWDGAAWSPLSGVVDGTTSGGASLAVDGRISWTRPASNWPLRALTSKITTQLYYVRLSWSAAMDGSTSVAEAIVGYFFEAVAVRRLGARLWFLWNGNRLAWTEDGGLVPTLEEAIKEIGDGTGAPIGIEGAFDTIYVRTTKVFGSVQGDGAPKVYMPSLSNPPASDQDSSMFVEWLDQIYFSHNYQTLQYSPGGVTPTIDLVGPERLFLNDQLVARVTTGRGHSTHALYEAWLMPNGHTWIAKWGTYLQTTDRDTGVIENKRMDAFNAIAECRARTLISMEVFTYGGRPYLVAGSTDGEVVWCKLPAGVSPLAPNADYPYNTFLNYLRLPTYYGRDASRDLTVYACSFVAKNLAATITASLWTKAPTESAWTLQGESLAVGGARVKLAVPYSGRGIDVRIGLQTDDPNTPPILESFTLHYQQDVRDELEVHTLEVLADDHVTDHDGFEIGWDAEDWDDQLDALAASELPLTLVRPGGKTEQVLVRGIHETYLRTAPGKTARRAYEVRVVTAE